MFFRNFNKNTREIFMNNIDAHNVLAWIIYQTNYDKGGYKDLSLHQCYISSSIISKSTKLNITKVKRILKKLENQGYFSYYFKSNGANKKPSIINVNFKLWNEYEYEPLNELEIEPANYINEKLANTDKVMYLKELKEPVCNLESKYLSKNISKNIYEYIIERFNSTCINLPKVTLNTERRKNAIKQILSEVEDDTEVILEVFDIVSKSSFLNGKNKNNWKANFDWIININNFTKILEGNYVDREPLDNNTNLKIKYDKYGYEII